MVSSKNVITLSNSTFSSWPPSETSCTVFGYCVVLEDSKVLLDSSRVLASVLLLFCFGFNSAISPFNTPISLDWFCWFVFYAFFVGDLDLLLECFQGNDWSFWCNVGLSLVVFVFWLILRDATFVLFFKVLAYVGFRVSCIVVVCDIFLFFSVSGLRFK